MSSNVFNLPTQPLDLPSKGLFYPLESPLSTGIIELKIPTAREEDILTNKNLVREGLAIDKFLESIIVSKINIDDLLIGDKDAVIVAARVLAYGKDYSFNYTIDGKTEEVTVDLTTIENKELDETEYTRGVNEFEYVLPFSKNVITYKFINGKDEKEIEKESKSLKKVSKNMSYEVTNRLKKTIVAVNGDRTPLIINTAVDSMPAIDSLSLRRHIDKNTPGLNLNISYTNKNGEVMEGLELPFTVDFFWPR